MPWLTIPALRGSITFDSTGTSVSVTEAPPSRRQLSTTTVSGISYTIGQLAITNFGLTLGMVQSFSEAGSLISHSSNAALSAAASGNVQVGGASGFGAAIGGVIDVSAQGSASATLTISHAGGWSPVSGSLASKFLTPAFSGSVTFKDDTSIQLSAEAQWTTDITLVSGVLVITKHPISTGTGAKLSVSLNRTAGGTSTSYAVGLLAGLRLGSASSAIPLLAVTGSLVSSGTSTLTLSTTTGFSPMPSQLDLSFPSFTGVLTLSDQSAFTLTASTSSVSTLSLCNDKLRLLGWAGSLSFESPQTALTVGATGQVLIGGVAGFSGSISAAFDLNTQSIVVTISHDGGYKPFPALLPNFQTSPFSATLSINKDGIYVNLLAELPLNAPVILFGGVVSLLGVGGAPGPKFALQLKQTTKIDAVTFGARFDATVCVTFDGERCVQVQASAGTTGFSLEGRHTSGNIKPLGGVTSLPERVRNLAVISGTASLPLTMVLHARAGSLTFQLSGTLNLDLSALQAGSYTLTMSAIGTFRRDESPRGAFIAQMTNAPSFSGDKGRLSAQLQAFWYLSLATHDGLPSVSVGAAQIAPPKGLAILYRGPSPLSELCAGHVSGQLALRSPTEMAFDAACETDTTIAITQVWNLNSMRFTMTRVGASLGPGSVGFRVGADFELSTGPAQSTPCSNRDTDAACLTANIDLGVGLILGPLFGLTLDFAVAYQGTWIEPCGLYNFAITDPSFSFGITISAGVVEPRQVSWGITIYWKRSGNWPNQLLTKTNPYTPPAVAGFNNLVAISSHFLYEKPQSTASLPRFAVKLVITQLKLTDILLMAFDIGRSAVRIASGQEISLVCDRKSPQETA